MLLIFGIVRNTFFSETLIFITQAFFSSVFFLQCSYVSNKWPPQAKNVCFFATHAKVDISIKYIMKLHGSCLNLVEGDVLVDILRHWRFCAGVAFILCGLDPTFVDSYYVHDRTVPNKVLDYLDEAPLSQGLDQISVSSLEFQGWVVHQ